MKGGVRITCVLCMKNNLKQNKKITKRKQLTTKGNLGTFSSHKSFLNHLRKYHNLYSDRLLRNNANVSRITVLNKCAFSDCKYQKGNREAFLKHLFNNHWTELVKNSQKILTYDKKQTDNSCKLCSRLFSDKESMLKHNILRHNNTKIVYKIHT
jgi:hypothetical protein